MNRADQLQQINEELQMLRLANNGLYKQKKQLPFFSPDRKAILQQIHKNMRRISELKLAKDGLLGNKQLNIFP